MLKQFIRYWRRLKSWRWNIGLCDTPLDDILAGRPLNIRWLRHGYTDRWFADPFILRADDSEIEFLVEEFPYSTCVGRIARIVADTRTMELKELHTILQLDTHLSFPAIMRKGDDIYIYPENGNSGRQDLYIYDRAGDTCRRIDTIVERPLADAVIARIGSRRYLLATEQPTHNGPTLMVMNYDGAKPEPLQNVTFGRGIGRNAGAVFEHRGKLYRPAQESVGDAYGIAVVLQQIDAAADGTLRFTDVATLRSPSPDLYLGFHTFNVYNNRIVVDAKGYRYRRLGPAAMLLRRLLTGKK